MARFLDNVPHSFGDKACQDAFIVRLQNSAQLTPKVKADKKISKDGLSHSTANFLATIASLCTAEVNHSQSQKLETSTSITASSRGTPQKSASSRSDRITGLQRLHQLTSVPTPTVESLTECLNSVTIAAKDCSVNLAIPQMGVAVETLATNNKFCSSQPWVICAKPENSFTDCTRLQTTPQVATAQHGKLRSMGLPDG